MAIRAIVLSIAGLSLLTFTLPLQAQEDYSSHPIAVTKITSDMVAAPTLGPASSGGGSTTSSTRAEPYGPNGRNTQWLRVEFQFEVHPPQSGAFLDEATFNVVIEGRDLSTNANGGQGIPVGLKGTVTYVNIYAGKNACGVVYIHPSTLERYAGPNGVKDFLNTFDVHVDAQVGGVQICALDEKNETDPAWFSKMKPITGLVYNKDQTPFIVSDVDKYPAIKLHTPSLE